VYVYLSENFQVSFPGEVGPTPKGVSGEVRACVSVSKPCKSEGIVATFIGLGGIGKCPPMQPLGLQSASNGHFYRRRRASRSS
jgi:hypothetical protein